MRSVAFSPNGKTLAAGCGGGVALWEVARQARLADKPLLVVASPVLSVAFSPEGESLAAGGGGGVVLWDTARWERLAEMPLSDAESLVESVAFSPDGKTLAAGTELDIGAGVVLWDVTQRRRLAEEPLAVAANRVTSVAFSPDGKTLAAGYRRGDGVSPLGGQAPSDREFLASEYRRGVSGGVMLWDARRHTRLADTPLEVTEGSVMSVAFSPDGKTIAAGYSGDNSGVVLWDAWLRRRLADKPLEINEGAVVTSVAFSPDGKSLAAGYGNIEHGRGGVVLFDLDLTSWQSRAERIANRNLTRDEWRLYFPETPYRATFRDLPVPPEEKSSNTPGPATVERNHINGNQ